MGQRGARHAFHRHPEHLLRPGDVLSVWFVPSGDRYDYEQVEPETHAAFKAARSKGRFFNEFVRDRYSFHLVAQGPQH
ncbi:MULTISPECIES: KTSC domain-containing protein [unclassified Mesorhizobium]|uniref:KTSC domain-containing protein n=1 Tax=unclassified Mesorhizobium TaxID=325217 RepID=UPI0027B9013C|nr:MULTISPECIES: KTSC domain-containing protein [unclassified Mesorhizobium]